MKKTNISLLLAVLLTSVTTNSVMSKEDCKSNCGEKHESWHQRHEERVEKERAAHKARKQAHHDRVMKENAAEHKKDAHCAGSNCKKAKEKSNKVKSNHEKNKNVVRDVFASPSLLVGKNPYADEDNSAE